MTRSLRRGSVLAGLVLMLAAPAAWAQSVFVSPTSGDPGTALTVSGTGWTSGDSIEVDIGGSQVCTVPAVGGIITGDQTTNGCQVPTGLTSGNQPLTADVTDGTTTARGSDFTVTPVASFTAPSSVDYGTPANFDASTSQGTITKYLWDFGDGHTASTTTPTISHSYPGVGSYVVTLTIVDSSGNTDSAAQTVSVTDTAPTAAFTPPAEAPTGTSLQFDGTSSSDPDEAITAYSWSFGDGTSSTLAQPTHTYSAAGTYPVTLTVTDAAGMTDSITQNVTVDDQPPVALFSGPSSQAVGTPANFDGSASNDPDGRIVSYDWNWGDGTSDGTTATPNHTFNKVGTFPVTLTVTDNSGNTNSTTQDVVVTGSPPTASFSAPPERLTGTVLSFDGTGSSTSNNGATITSYDWNWGDGTPDGSGPKPTHSYVTAGSYTVTLTVTDSTGEISPPFSQTVVVDDRPPVASFSGPSSLPVGATGTFDGSASNDPDGTISYDWNWGDGTPDGSGAAPTHAFTADGTYPVTLTVTDNSGNSSSETHNVVVTGNRPTAAFQQPPEEPVGTTLTFDGSGSSTTNPGATITNYAWSWGDGNANSTPSPTTTHSYATAGTYTVTLTVTDTAGAVSAAISHTVTVAGPLTAAFTPNAATVLAGSNVAFDGTGSSDPNATINNYNWSFGDGGAATGQQATHKYMNVGTFNVTLTETDNFGKTSSVTHQITVIAPPPLQTLILTPVAKPTVVKWSRVSATHSGHIDLGERLFCSGPGPGCTAYILVTSKSLLHGGHLASVKRRSIAANKSMTIKSNGSAEVTFKLSKRARAYLKKHHRLPVRVKITIVRGSQTTTSILSLVFVSH